MRHIVSALTVLIAAGFVTTAYGSLAFVNEFHYDNVGGDTGEFVEFAVESGTDLMTVEFFLVNGNDSEDYDNILASDGLEDREVIAGATGLDFDGVSYDLFVWNPSSVQNGAPDGIAISTSMGLQDFVSYEGVITNATIGDTSTGGPFTATSTDVGVTQNNDTTLEGSSIQLIGNTWTNTDGFNTSGEANSATNVPEPTSMTLFGFAVLAYISPRRRSA